MSNEVVYADADPDLMRPIAAQLDPPGIAESALRREIPQSCGAPGMSECHDLLMTDRTTTAELQEFVTHIMQGFAALKAMTFACADCYADGNGMAESEFTTIRDRRDLNLTDRDPRFDPQIQSNGE